MKSMLKRTVSTMLLAITVLACCLFGWHASSQSATPEALGKAASVEGRAVWVSARQFSPDKDEAVAEMEATFDEWAGLGINNLFVFSSTYSDEWDVLGTILELAHARGMKVHPCYCPGGHVQLEGEIAKHPEWLIQGFEGHQNLNPSNPGAREYMLREIEELLKYDIDGLHFDYIRFPVRQGFSYDSASRAAFEREFGRDPLSLRHHNSGSAMWVEWIRWNANNVTNLLRETRDLLKRKGKEEVLISAAVFPDPDSAAYMIGQEWEVWAQEGLVDILCPMLYTNNLDVFRKYTRKAVNVAKGRCLFYAGIACRSSHNINTPEGVAREVEIAREEGADGVVFFSGSSLVDDFIAQLKSTVFAE